VEPVPYLLSNPTFLIRENRFGRIPVFTKTGQLDLSLAQILATARKLQADTQRPVVILMQQSINTSQPDTTYSEAYDWQLIATRAMVADFLANTQRIASFPPLRGNEGFDVYTLK
jgi:hypothetical protein